MSHPTTPDGRRSFTHDALVLLGNRFAVMAVSMITGVVLARCLGTSGRGVVAAVTVYPSIFLSLTELGLRQAAVYFVGKGIYTNAQVVGALAALVLVSGSFGVGVCTALLWWVGNSEFTPLIIALAVGTIPLAILRDYGSGILLGNRMVGQFAKISRMVEVQRLLTVLLFVWLLGWQAAGALLASLLSGAVVAGYAVWRVSRIATLRPCFDWALIRALVQKGVVYALSLFVITLTYKVNTVIMERLSTVEEIGYYTIGIGIATLTWAFPQAITTALFSHSANARDELAFSLKVARLFRVTIILALFLVVFLWLAAPWLVPAIYGEQYRPSVRVLRLLLPGVFCLLGLKVLNMDLAGRGQPNVSLWIMTPALIINVLLGLYWVPGQGADGAALASSVAYVAGGLGIMVLYCRLTGMGIVELCRFHRQDFDFLKRLRSR